MIRFFILKTKFLLNHEYWLFYSVSSQCPHPILITCSTRDLIVTTIQLTLEKQLEDLKITIDKRDVIANRVYLTYKYLRVTSIFCLFNHFCPLETVIEHSQAKTS